MRNKSVLCILCLLLLVMQLPVSALGLHEGLSEPSMAEESKPSTESMEAKKTTETEKSGLLKIVGTEIPMENVAFIPTFDSSEAEPKDKLAEARKLIHEGMLNFTGEISLYGLQITFAELHSIITDLHSSEAMLFHVNGQYRYRIYDNDYVYSVLLTYNTDAATYKKQCEFAENEIQKILTDSGVLQIDDDFSQALILNDYLASHYEYDLTYTYYDMYSMMVYKKGVCQAYTLFYDELLTRCGIEVWYAQSEAMNHIWNLVKIGNHFYHVDVTWNDPVSDKYSMADHEYFMLSDAYVASDGPRNPHHSWVSHDGIVCDDDTYDATILTQSESPFVLCEGEIYYIESETGNISKYIDAFTVGTTVYTIDSIWYVADKPGYYYPGTFSGLASFEGKLYFNTADQVGAYDVKEGTVEWIATAQDNAGDIVGVRYIGERTVEYGLAADAASKQLTALYTYLIPKAQLLMGDLNEDDVVDMKDAAVLQRHVLKINEITDESVLAAADVMGDGIVDMKDAAKLTRFVIKVIDSLE
ncbi:MAG: hypothetical protein E7599_05810 [Ruminococcaceae bacterium]|nr:hypothetical protein [Oscillospiraceae bacterium]